MSCRRTMAPICVVSGRSLRRWTKLSVKIYHLTYSLVPGVGNATFTLISVLINAKIRVKDFVCALG